MVSDILNNYRLILASASPRRRQLLTEAGLMFISAEVDCDEKWPSELKGREIAEYLANIKADLWNTELSEREILITADTIVWCNDTVIGKPADADEAAKFLSRLSGCDHEVITGICIKDSNRKHIFSVSTRVTFRVLTGEEIACYVEECRPFDKAGAYGIQEWIGLIGITRIEGSYYNVVGMPVSEFYTELINFINRRQ
jgi:septum formation protein